MDCGVCVVSEFITQARPRNKTKQIYFPVFCSFYFNSFGSLSLSIVYYPSANELAIVSVSFSTDKQGTLTISNETHNFQFLIKKYISKISFSLKSLRDFEYRPFLSSQDHARQNISYTAGQGMMAAVIWRCQ